MTESEVLADIGYLKSVAEEGRNTPLLGGRIGLMWTALLVPCLFLHGLTAMGVGPIPIPYIGALWMGFGVTGGVLTFVLSRGLDKKPGANSMANKIESVMWPLTAMLIFAYAIALALGAALTGVDPVMFNTIMPLAFALSAINLGLLGALTRRSYFTVCAFMAALAMIACALLVHRPEVYFVAAGGVLLTGVMPNLLQLRDERRAE